MATPGSPRDDEADDLPHWSQDRTGGDFGYSAGACEINRRFKLDLTHVRRTTPAWALPHAVRMLREQRVLALRALRERCARKRHNWHLAGRELAARLRLQQSHRPQHRASTALDARLETALKASAVTVLAQPNDVPLSGRTP